MLYFDAKRGLAQRLFKKIMLNLAEHEIYPAQKC